MTLTPIAIFRVCRGIKALFSDLTAGTQRKRLFHFSLNVEFVWNRMRYHTVQNVNAIVERNLQTTLCLMLAAVQTIGHQNRGTREAFWISRALNKDLLCFRKHTGRLLSAGIVLVSDVFFPKI